MARPTVAVLKLQHHGDWQAQHERGEVAGGPLGPYSVDLLERSGFEVVATDALFGGLWARPPLRPALGVLDRRSPALRGIANALAHRGLLRRSDVALALFEDQGSFAAAVRSLTGRRAFPAPLAIVSCWMAEDARHASPRRLRAYRRVLAGADLVLCFSENQVATYVEVLGVEPSKVRSVPFGVDGAFFAEEPTSDDGTVLSVGNDANRDHRTLVEAARRGGFATHVVGPRPLPDLPPSVRWTSERVDHRTYRALLAAARVVAVPTEPVAYPCGQTVVLEAMAAGKAVIATDTPAMREYVEHDVDGVLVPPADPGALAAAVARLDADPDVRARLGAAGRAKVLGRLHQRAMWDAIGAELRALVERR